MSTDPKITPTSVRKSAKGSPAYCELRYFRTPAWLARHGAPKRDYLLLGMFALMDRQYPFALDLCAEYRNIFREDAQLQALKDVAIRKIREAIRERRSLARKIRRLFLRKGEM
jgi:hypothetical protein